MENSGSDNGGNRVAALEKKVDGVGVLVGKFTQELLDLKAMTREMSQNNKEHCLQEHGSAQEAGAPEPDPARGTGTADPMPDEPPMVMIMQTDGTMQLEVRRGNRDCTLAPAGYGASGGSSRRRKGAPIEPGQSRLSGTF